MSDAGPSSPTSRPLFSLDDSSSRELSHPSGHVQPDHSSNGDALPAYDASPTPPARTRGTFGLKSMTESREAEFDADDDVLDDDTLDVLSSARINDVAGPVGSRGGDGRRSHTVSQSRGDSQRGNRSSDGGTRRLVDRIPGLPTSRASLEGIGEELRHLRHAASEELPEWLKRGAGVFDGTVNMANSILGAGIVGLPYSMRESGFVAGLGLLIGLALLTDWTIRLIVLNAKLSGRGTYIEIMEHCFGGNGKAAVSIFQFAFAFGGMCAFCVVIGDTIPQVISSVFPSLAGSFLANRQFVIAFCTLTISYPLSLYRNIESLSRASAIALFSMVLIILTVLVRGPAMPAELKGDPSLRFTLINPVNIVRSIAVISFAFVCHHNSLLIYGSLKEPTMDRFGKVTHYSTMIAAGGAIAMSVGGYWSFEDKTLSNVLNNFPNDDTMVNLARFCFGVNMFTTFPLEAFVCREVLEEYFFDGEFDQRRHLVFTSSLVVSALFVSLTTCDLGVVLELTGGLSATALAFIFPSICYLHLSRENGGRLPPASLPTLTGISSHSRDSRRPGGDEDGEDSGDEDLEDLEGRVDVEDVELPLRPGANVRHRPPATQRSWWQSTKPLAVAVSIFGIVVLVVSVFTAIRDAATGRGGAVHQC